MKQFIVTPSAGKRLIAKAIVKHPHVQAALKSGILTIVAGSTNGYVAEEVLTTLGQADGFGRKGFRRGMVTPPGFDAAAAKADFSGDVVIVKGLWQRGKEIFDFVEQMDSGDVILKGGNALDVAGRRAAVLIGHPMGGTIGASIPAVIGRRVRLIIPIGLEKRVADDLDALAAKLNSPAAAGPRMAVMPGEAFTELDAIALLTGAAATLVSGGGVYGAEGASWIVVEGTAEQESAAAELVKSVAAEPLCQA